MEVSSTRRVPNLARYIYVRRSQVNIRHHGSSYLTEHQKVSTYNTVKRRDKLSLNVRVKE